MGTSGFWSFYHSLIKTVPISQINGRITFVDIILYIHKYVIGIRKSGSDIKTRDGRNIIHLFALTKIIKNFTDHNILPICIFDGKSPSAKSESIGKRRELIELSKERCEELRGAHSGDTTEYIKHFKRSFNITNEMLNDCREYLTLAGIPFINSIGEADPQCAGMSHYYSNVNSGVFSEDSDILLYGAPNLIKDLDLRTNCVSIIYMKDILNFLQEKADYISTKYGIDRQVICRQHLIDFSVIMGNDYCSGIRCSGNFRDRMFELFVLSEFNFEIFIEMINTINEKKIKFYIPENFSKKWYESREIYNNVDIINPSLIDIRMKRINSKNLRKFLEKYDFRNDVIEHITSSLQNLYVYFDNAIIFKQPEKDDEWKDDEWKVVKRKKIDSH